MTGYIKILMDMKIKTKVKIKNTITMSLKVKDEKNFKNYRKIWKKN